MAHGEKEQKSHCHGEQAVFLDDGVGDNQRTLEQGRPGHMDGVRSPDHVDHLLRDDEPAHGDENLLEVMTVDRLDDDALEGEPEKGRDGHGREDREKDRREVCKGSLRGPRARHPRDNGKADECSHGDERPVAEVDHVHESEDHGKPRRHDEDHEAHREPRDRKRQPGRGRPDGQQPEESQGGREEHGRGGGQTLLECCGNHLGTD